MTAPPPARFVLAYTADSDAAAVFSKLLVTSKREDFLDLWLRGGPRADAPQWFESIESKTLKGKPHSTPAAKAVSMFGNAMCVRDAIVGLTPADSMLVVTSVLQDSDSLAHLTNAAAFCDTFAIKRVIIVVNHIDKIEYDEVTFGHTAALLDQLFAGVRLRRVVPASTAAAEGLLPRANTAGSHWYSRGPTALEAVYALPPLPSLETAPMRAVVQASYKIGGIGIVNVVKIVSGTIKWPTEVATDQMNGAVSAMSAMCTTLEIHHCWVHDATVGERVGLRFRPPLKTVNDLPVGEVLYYPHQEERLLRSTRRIIALLCIVKQGAALTVGSEWRLRMHSLKAKVQVTGVVNVVSRATGRPFPVDPTTRGFRMGQIAAVQLDFPDADVCLEEYARGTQLGRFALDSPATLGPFIVAIGIVTKV